MDSLRHFLSDLQNEKYRRTGQTSVIVDSARHYLQNDDLNTVYIFVGSVGNVQQLQQLFSPAEFKRIRIINVSIENSYRVSTIGSNVSALCLYDNSAIKYILKSLFNKIDEHELATDSYKTYLEQEIELMQLKNLAFTIQSKIANIEHSIASDAFKSDIKFPKFDIFKKI